MTPERLTDPANPHTNPLPDQAQELVRLLLEGRVSGLFLCAEYQDEHGKTEYLEGYELDLDGHKTDRRRFFGSVRLLTDDLSEDCRDEGVYMIEIGGDDSDDQEEE